jgi:hypothetical protein
LVGREQAAVDVAEDEDVEPLPRLEVRRDGGQFHALDVPALEEPPLAGLDEVEQFDVGVLLEGAHEPASLGAEHALDVEHLDARARHVDRDRLAVVCKPYLVRQRGDLDGAVDAPHLTGRELQDDPLRTLLRV